MKKIKKIANFEGKLSAFIAIIFEVACPFKLCVPLPGLLVDPQLGGEDVVREANL